ncbi:MAG: putative baseplate assembly protein, partial [Planctomycetota bacterium]
MAQVRLKERRMVRFSDVIQAVADLLLLVGSELLEGVHENGEAVGVLVRLVDLRVLAHGRTHALNPSDPGVTLIEVFAVALEELLYRLNRVLPKHMREYLNMIGVTLTPASAAKTDVIFTLSEPQSFDIVIGRGFEVSTAGSSGVPPVVFTTDEDLVIPSGEPSGSVSVSNASEVAEEALGSSDGSRDQRFYLANVPVLDATVLVDEGSGFEVWTETDDFSDSGPDDRHYVLNRGAGEVLFGDGRHGKAPEAGARNVKASPYRYGGGTRGNVGAGTITQLRSSHVYIDRVTNPEAAVGGGNEETVEEAIARRPTEQLKARNRAVAAEDFETLTLESSTGLARAKTLPLYDPAHPGEETPGVVSVIAMPKGGGTLSQALRDAIRAHLDERRLVTTRIYVIDPDSCPTSSRRTPSRSRTCTAWAGRRYSTFSASPRGTTSRPLVDELVRQVAAEIGEADGVLVIDPSAHHKKGNGSVGVKPQWNGRLGKIDNCQVGIYLAYASRKEHALVDERLFLPEEWADDQQRRDKCGVPKDVRFRTRHELALEMLRAHRKRLPHAWVTGDDEMGRAARFRASLRSMRETYLLAVPSNTRVRDLEGRAPIWSGVGRPPKCPLEQA